MRTMTVATLALAALLAFGGCSKKEEPVASAPPPPPKSLEPEMPASHPPIGQPGEAAPTGAPVQRQVVVPDEVRNTWKAVVFAVTDSTENKTQDVTVEVGQPTTLGDLEITVTAFLPSFSMGGGAITSKSNETENPAAQLVVKDKGVEIFTGWLFSLYPEAHPFQHERYSMVLKDFVKSE